MVEEEKPVKTTELSSFYFKKRQFRIDNPELRIFNYGIFLKPGEYFHHRAKL